MTSAWCRLAILNDFDNEDMAMSLSVYAPLDTVNADVNGVSLVMRS